MGPKNSCSCADITMAAVDEIITTQGHLNLNFGAVFEMIVSVSGHKVNKVLYSLQIS